jgi:predicted Zn-dependent protease
MMLRLGRAPEAALAARRALALEPFSPNAWITLASAQLAGRDVEGAQVSLGRALALLHDQPLALFVGAQAALAAGDPRRAASAELRLRAMATTGSEDPAIASAARELVAKLPEIGQPTLSPGRP